LGLMPNCSAAACVLRLSLAKRRASALNASSYLRRFSGDAPLAYAAITEEIYALLLSGLTRPPQVANAVKLGSEQRLLEHKHFGVVGKSISQQALAVRQGFNIHSNLSSRESSKCAQQLIWRIDTLYGQVHWAFCFRPGRNGCALQLN
jgi:hypothetical protein